METIGLLFGRLLHPFVRDPDRDVAARELVGVTVPIVLEVAAETVELPAVEFDNDAFGGEQRVNLSAVDLDVGERGRQVEALAECDEPDFEL